ncbi:MAG: hypothetical protein R3F55_19305 [Alphaproteobacteria bacterium]
MSDRRSHSPLRPALPLLAAATFALSACVPGVGPQGPTASERLDQAIGQNERDIIGRWGRPDDVYEYADGTRAVTWEYGYWQESWQEEWHCEITLDLNSAGTVVDWHMSFINDAANPAMTSWTGSAETSPATSAQCAVAAVLALALSGCADGTRWAESRDAETLNGFIGRSARDAVAAWGPPSSTYGYGDGRKELTYRWSETVDDKTQSCEWTLVIDADGTIGSWRRATTRLGAGLCENDAARE